MAGFPWAWLLISTGFSMLFQEQLEQWIAERLKPAVEAPSAILLVAAQDTDVAREDDDSDRDDDGYELSSIGSSSGEPSSE